MRRFIAAVSAAALLLSSLPVYAGGGAWRSGHGYSGYYSGVTVSRHVGYRSYEYRPYHKSYRRYGGSYRYYHHRKHRYDDDDIAFALLGGLVGGVVIGSALSQPRYVSPPPPAYAPPRFTHCLPTTGVRLQYGREALYGGTMCYDRYGRGFIQNDSVRFLYYLD